MKQIEIIKDWCKDKKITFWNCDEETTTLKKRKIPCSLDKNYQEDNSTIFISGFFKGSKKVKISYGGLLTELVLKVPINEYPVKRVLNWMPKNWICPRCNKLNLNLRTDDNHKTYVCTDCHKDKE